MKNLFFLVFLTFAVAQDVNYKSLSSEDPLLEEQAETQKWKANVSNGEKITVVTAKGERISGIVSSSDPDGIGLLLESGIRKVKFKEMTKEDREKMGYDSKALNLYLEEKKNALQKEAEALTTIEKKKVEDADAIAKLEKQKAEAEQVTAKLEKQKAEAALATANLEKQKAEAAQATAKIVAESIERAAKTLATKETVYIRDCPVVLKK